MKTGQNDNTSNAHHPSSTQYVWPISAEINLQYVILKYALTDKNIPSQAILSQLLDFQTFWTKLILIPANICSNNKEQLPICQVHIIFKLTMHSLLDMTCDSHFVHELHSCFHIFFMYITHGFTFYNYKCSSLMILLWTKRDTFEHELLWRRKCEAGAAIIKQGGGGQVKLIWGEMQPR